MPTLCQPHDAHPHFTGALRARQPAENTQLSYLVIDWRAACLLMSDQEAQTAWKRQRHASEANRASRSASANKIWKCRTFSRVVWPRFTATLIRTLATEPTRRTPV